MYSPLNSETRQRLQAIDERIENMKRVINNIQGRERFYFQNRMLSVRVKKQMLLDMSAYAESEKSRLIMAERKVLLAECDLNIEIESIRLNKKFRLSERSLERRERRRRREDIQHSTTIVLGATVSETPQRNGETPFTIQAQVFQIPVSFPSHNPDNHNATSNNSDNTEEVDKQSHHANESCTSVEEESEDGEISDKDDFSECPTDGVTNEEAIVTSPAEPVQEKLATHNNIKDLFRTYKQIYIPSTGNQAASQSPINSPKTQNHEVSLNGSHQDYPKTAIHTDLLTESPGDSPETTIYEDFITHSPKDSPKTAIPENSPNDIPRNSPKTEIHEDSSKIAHPGDSPTFNNSDGESNYSKKSQPTESSFKTTTNTIKTQSNCSQKSQSSEKPRKNCKNISNGSKKHSRYSPRKAKKSSESTKKSKNCHTSENLHGLDVDIFQKADSSRSFKRPYSPDSSSQKTKSSRNGHRSNPKKAKTSHHSTKDKKTNDFNINQIFNDEKAICLMTELVKLRCAMESPKRLQELNSKAMESNAIPSTSQESIVNDLFKDMMASKRVQHEINCPSDNTVSCHKCGTVDLKVATHGAISG